ncbi:hypothetical protein O6H91_19G072200 [Diphasiastrum complanatum]|uniref:Uncharacterized protein n=1 Tax=Diphasiastrum complanatum TaxID=34168 RepID=A0ACC2AWG7_DIPCM|nr:hypothetical protein O6H91_19G072200 [Diphasiastrum complanatum]
MAEIVSNGRSNSIRAVAPYPDPASNEAVASPAASDNGQIRSCLSSFPGILWNGGSRFDAWLNATSSQIAQVLLTFPYSFAQMGLASGIVFQVFYGLVGCWTAFMIASLYAEYDRKEKQEKNVTIHNHVIQWFEILNGLLGCRWKVVAIFFNTSVIFCMATIQIIACGSTVYYINQGLPKRTWTIIFGACCMSTIFVPTAHNLRVFSFFGILMTSYTAWYMTIASVAHGQVPNVKLSGAKNLEQYFTGATNLLFAFGGHAVTVEIMHAMWKPTNYKKIYLYAILYIFTITIPSATAVYWAFGEALLHNANAFAVLPRSVFRDVAVILMLLHQFIAFGMFTLSLYLIWEKLLGVHHSNHFIIRAVARIPVVLLIWVVAVAMPFFGPINSTVGSLLVTFCVYIIPCIAHMAFYKKAVARENAIEKPPFWVGSWTGMYMINTFVVVWVAIIGVGFGGWASVTNIVKQIHTFGFFAKCYQCAPKAY